MKKNLSTLNYGIVGLGIMGGSFAKAIRKNVICNGSGKIFALDKNGSALCEAENQHVIDKGFLSDRQKEMLGLCDFVFISLYPNDTLRFIKENALFFKKDSIVTDISGVKTSIFKELGNDFKCNADFISGHPMAGGAKEGFSEAKAEYFENRNYILIPQEKNNAENYELFKNLIKKLGFSKITETTADIHDYKIGFTSQLCHVIASALVQSAPDSHITDFGGGSFEDLTRIAMINAPLWTELFISNKDKLCSHIDIFMEEMQSLKNMINDSDSDKLNSYLEKVRSKRSQM